jgi:invasion protein IalB
LVKTSAWFSSKKDSNSFLTLYVSASAAAAAAADDTSSTQSSSAVPWFLQQPISQAKRQCSLSLKMTTVSGNSVGLSLRAFVVSNDMVLRSSVERKHQSMARSFQGSYV